MTVDIDEVFADLDQFYPGSRRKRRPEPENSTRRADAQSWDSKPLVKMFNGTPTEFFYTGDFAKALGKSPVTMRLWERKSYIPKSPYRLPSTLKKDGTSVPGKRVFTRPLIEAAVDEFGQRGLLGAARVEWKHHRDLTIALVERWSAITEIA